MNVAGTAHSSKETTLGSVKWNSESIYSCLYYIYFVKDTQLR